MNYKLIVILILFLLLISITNAQDGDDSTTTYDSDNPDKFDYSKGDYSSVPPDKFKIDEAQKYGRLSDVTASQWEQGNNLNTADNINAYPSAQQTLKNKHSTVTSIQGSCTYRDGTLVGADGIQQNLNDLNLQSVKVNINGHLEITSKKDKAVDVTGRELSGSAVTSLEPDGTMKMDTSSGSRLGIKKDGVTEASGMNSEVDIYRTNSKGNTELTNIRLGSSYEQGMARIDKEGFMLDLELENALVTQYPDGEFLSSTFEGGSFKTASPIRVTDNPGLLSTFYQNPYYTSEISPNREVSSYVDLLNNEEWITYSTSDQVVIGSTGGTVTKIKSPSGGPAYVSLGGSFEPFAVEQNPTLIRYTLQPGTEIIPGLPPTMSRINYEVYTDNSGDEISHDVQLDLVWASYKIGTTTIYPTLRYINIGPGEFFSGEPVQISLSLLKTY